MPRQCRPFLLTVRQQELLQDLVVARDTPQGLAQRAQIILRSYEGAWNYELAKELGCERHAIGSWRRRWKEAEQKLLHAECLGRPGALRQTIAKVLGDRPRCGSPGKFTAEQVALLLAVACEPPQDSGRPVSHWTARELADEVTKRKIVPAISARQVGRFLKDSGTETSAQSVLAEQQSEGQS